jgi:hypothetical protein
MTDQEVLNELGTRNVFSGACAKIDRVIRGRVQPSMIEIRRMEFDAVKEIAAVLGVELRP